MRQKSSKNLLRRTFSASKKLPRQFYLQPTLQVAKALLGKYLVRNVRGQRLVGKIVEVEAYRGSLDPASHAYRGRTRRNEVMFWSGGHLYVYFTYGMHFCANVVTREEGIAEAILIRGIEPIKGKDFMRRHRGAAKSELNLTNGPAKFCEAFAIARKENGLDLTGHTIYLTEGESYARGQIATSTRIGIKVGTERKWRFFLKDNQWVSRK